MKKWIMRIHMYTGLLFFGFLIVFAASAIIFNHKPEFADGETPIDWQQPVTNMPHTDSPESDAKVVGAQLGLGGRVLPAGLSRKDDNLNFIIARPGRRYTVHIAGGLAKVAEKKQNWATTLVNLHGVRPSTNSILLNAWAWYASIGALVLGGSALTGILLFAIRPRERVLGWSVLGIATALSLAICFYIRTRG